MNDTQFASNISGTSLPHGLYAAAVVEHQNSFLIIGGFGRYGSSSSFYSDKIYKYDTAGDGQWLELPTTLSEGKAYVTAIKVKSSIFPSC